MNSEKMSLKSVTKKGAIKKLIHARHTNNDIHGQTYSLYSYAGERAADRAIFHRVAIVVINR